MTIRRAKLSDLKCIVEIYNETIASRMVTADTEPSSVEDKLAWFDTHHDERPLFVFEREAQVLAWLSFKSFYGRPAYDGTCEISIYITQSARGQGLGSKLLEFAESHAPSIQISNILGFIFSHNKPSIRLFERHNYAKWGELPNIACMDNNHFSLTIMGKSLLENCKGS